MAQDESALSLGSESNDGPDPTVMLRRIGYGLLVAAVVADIASGPILAARQGVRKQWFKVLDEALPRENILLDVALGFLGASGH